jgi:hypothetical protein
MYISLSAICAAGDVPESNPYGSMDSRRLETRRVIIGALMLTSSRVAVPGSVPSQR